MKLITNGQRLLNELFQQYFRENGSYADEADYFEYFAAKSILVDRELSDEEIDRGVLGAGNDGGCDAVYTFFNGNLMTEDVVDTLESSRDASIELVIIQAKRETSFREDVIMKWKTIASNLFEIGTDDSQYQARYNEDVLCAFALFRNLYVKQLRNTPKLTVKFYYASFSSELHPNVVAQGSELIGEVKKLFPSPRTIVTVDFLGADQLLEAAQAQPEHRLSLPLADTPINIGAHRDFVALVQLAKYFKFITDDRGELRKSIFEANVRDYQGHNAVNQDIQDSLSNPNGEEFWWLNNGITMLADEVEQMTNKELVLTDPSVVNGLQTSNEIYRYFKTHPDELEKENRCVLVRIVVPENEASRDRIILATNNQTSIPKSSLRANDPIHWQIELYLKGRGLYYDRRKNYYKNQGKKSTEIVSVSFLSQCMISLLLQKPDYARARPSTLLTRDETYNAIYTDSPDLDAFFKAAKLGKIVEHYLKVETDYAQAQVNDIMFYVLYYGAAKHIGKVLLKSEDLKALDLDFFSSENLEVISADVFTMYQELGGNSKIAKGTELIAKLKDKLSRSN